MKKTILTFILLLFCYQSSSSQSTFEPEFRVGVFIDYAQNYHTANFIFDDELATCTRKDVDAENYSMPFGAFLEYQPFEIVSFQLKVFRDDLSGDFYSGKDTYASLVRDENGNTSLVYSTTQVVSKTHLRTIAIGTGAMLNITDALTFTGGVDFNFFTKGIYSSDYRLIDSELTFEDGTKIVVFADDEDIPDLSSMFISLDLNLRYEIPLTASGDFSIAPEIGFMYGLTSLLKNDSWDIYQFRAGVVILYTI
jgi:hypothetical protein